MLRPPRSGSYGSSQHVIVEVDGVQLIEGKPPDRQQRWRGEKHPVKEPHCPGVFHVGVPPIWPEEAVAESGGNHVRGALVD